MNEQTIFLTEVVVCIIYSSQLSQLLNQFSQRHVFTKESQFKILLILLRKT